MRIGHSEICVKQRHFIPSMESFMEELTARKFCQLRLYRWILLSFDHYQTFSFSIVCTKCDLTLSNCAKNRPSVSVSIPEEHTFMFQLNKCKISDKDKSHKSVFDGQVLIVKVLLKISSR